MDGTNPLDSLDCSLCPDSVSGHIYDWKSHTLMEAVDLTLTSTSENVSNPNLETTSSNELGNFTFERKFITPKVLEPIVSEGNIFLNDVFKKGALCAIVSELVPNANGDQIEVSDTIKAIGKVATEWRSQFDIPVIGITGTNGKTSTKELLKHILSSKFDIHDTEGNYNTSIGLPLTLLQLTSFHGASILEMGANQIGDIDILAKIAKPNIGLITNIAPAHLEGFGSIEAVAKTKAAIFENLHDGIAFVNYADDKVRKIKATSKSISFGINPDCDYPADIHYEEDGTITLTINAEEIPTFSSNLSLSLIHI